MFISHISGSVGSRLWFVLGEGLLPAFKRLLVAASTRAVCVLTWQKGGEGEGAGLPLSSPFTKVLISSMTVEP